ncbi:MAG: diguanylate cyclase [Chroococcidiopsidaceae cyanobacterium CP_BM_RX_35]|nr:diguanylate cyclase [Chroococcidiopsidaceae cyanobacterium CP_BM_RX_35]
MLPDLEPQYRLLFTDNPNPMWVYDLETLAFLEVNEAAIRHYGYSRSEFLTMTIADIRPSEDISALKDSVLKMPHSRSQWRHRQKHGRIIQVEVTSSAITFAGRRAGLILANDVTERRQTEEALKESQRRLSSLIDSLPGIVFSSSNDSKWSMTYLSEGCLRLTGYKSEELLGNGSYNSIVHAEDLPNIYQAIASAAKSKQPYTIEYRIRTKTGQEKWFWEKGSGVFDSNGKVLCIEGFITDITESKQVQEKLMHDACHDRLTGLPNRALFTERLQQALNCYQQHRDELFAVLFLDLDRFKTINDSLGHAVGDQLLVEIGHKLKLYLRPGDTIARLGGDEFALLLKNLDDPKLAEEYAKQIQQQLTTPFNLRGHEVIVSISIGIALSHFRYQQPDDLLRDADIAMFQAKQRGRSYYQVFAPQMYTHAVDLLSLEQDLHRAFERHEFQVYYQAIVSFATYQIAGFEALVRWQHPRYGLLSPAKFLPVAQETGLIVQLDWWMMQEACHQIVQWQAELALALPLTKSTQLPEVSSGRTIKPAGDPQATSLRTLTSKYQ